MTSYLYYLNRKAKMPATVLVSLLTTSNNIVDSHKASSLHVITVTATYNAAATSITGTLNGHSIAFTRVGITFAYTAPYTVVATDTQGAIALNIVADTVTSTTTTDSNPVVIDTIVPTGTIAYTSTGSLLFPKVGDVHTINFISSEVLLGVPRMNFGYLRTARLNSIVTTSFPNYTWTNISSLVWQATYIITGNEIIPGSITFNFTDLTGNIGSNTYYLLRPGFLSNQNYSYYDEFINDGLGRFYDEGIGEHDIIAPEVLGQNGVAQFQVTNSGDVSGYNISKNYTTFLYQTYNWLQLDLYITNSQITNSGDTAMIRFGFVDSDESTMGYGIYFESDSGTNKWGTATAIAGTIVKNESTAAINTVKTGGSHAYLLSIIYDSVNAYFYINNILIDQQAYVVSNPIGTGIFPSPGVYIIKTSGTTNLNYINADYISVVGKR